jgi:hypothetical protein
VDDAPTVDQFATEEAAIPVENYSYHGDIPADEDDDFSDTMQVLDVNDEDGQISDAELAAIFDVVQPDYCATGHFRLSVFR